MAQFQKSVPKGKNGGWRTVNNGLPFPNFALGKTEIPAVCKCIYDGTNFYVTNHLDMHTLHYNGSFGTSSLTYRGLSYDDVSFKRKAYYKKKFKGLTSDLPLNGSSIGCFRAGKGKRVRVAVEPSKSGGPELHVHLSSEGGECSSPDSSTVQLSSDMTEDSRVLNQNLNEMSVDYATDLSSDDLTRDGSDSKYDDKSTENSGRNKRVPIINIDTQVLEEEKLILMPEEAIFLSFGVGCLAIYNLQGQTLDYRQCWRNLVTLDADFPTQYAAYHYFRGKNWVPKCGGVYGASYVLYEGGPDSRHATYIVYLLQSQKPKPTWMELAGWQRMATHVSKQVLLCEISVPEAFRPEASEPRSVFEMKLREMSLLRWTPRNESDRS